MRKGFTLIELLAVIVVLTVISLIAVPRIMDAIDESRAGALRQNNEAVIKAVQNYFVDNAIDLPQTIGETAEISLEQLIQNDLINEISSPYSSNNCSGYVLVTKVEGGHEFIPHINCFENINNSSQDELIAHYTFNDFQEPTKNLKDELILIAHETTVETHTDSLLGEGYLIKTDPDGHSAQSVYFSLKEELEPGTPVTVSFYTNSENEAARFNLRNNTLRLTDDVRLTTISSNRVSATLIVPDGNNTNRVRIYPETLGEDFFISKISVEAKEHATPYVEDERTGVIFDRSLNNYNGTLNLNTSPKWINNVRNGNGSYLFNGVDEHISIPLSKAGHPYTLTTWAKRTSPFPPDTSFVSIAGWRYSTESLQGINYHPDYLIRYRDYHGGPTSTSSGVNMNIDEWYMISVTHDGDYVRIYINGELTREAEQSLSPHNSNEFQIGATKWREGQNRAFGGIIDEVRVYGRTLSSDEIKQLYVNTR